MLLLRLAGPLQSWGSTSRFARRATEAAPTKSGVVGLLAAALGRTRQDDVSDLAALRFGVRLDQPGVRLRDFQTAHHLQSGRAMPVSERFYLADAVFVAGVEGPDPMLDTLDAALRRPAFLPYLGRRSCPPAEEIPMGIRRNVHLDRALADEPWQATAVHRRRRRSSSVDVTVLLESAPGDPPGDLWRDHPTSFDPRHRQYALRSVSVRTVTLANPSAPPTRGGPAAHDPTSLLAPLDDA